MSPRFMGRMPMLRQQEPSSHDFHSEGARRMLLAIGFAVVLVHAAAIDVFADPPVLRPAWTTHLSEMKVPDAPVSGMIHGRRFTVDKVNLRDFGLKLQHGREEFGDLSVTITLDARRTDLSEGATYSSGPGSDDRHRGSFRSVCVTENAGPSSHCETHDFAMSLELSKLTNGVV